MKKIEHTELQCTACPIGHRLYSILLALIQLTMNTGTGICSVGIQNIIRVPQKSIKISMARIL